MQRYEHGVAHDEVGSRERDADVSMGARGEGIGVKL